MFFLLTDESNSCCSSDSFSDGKHACKLMVSILIPKNVRQVKALEHSSFESSSGTPKLDQMSTKVHTYTCGSLLQRGIGYKNSHPNNVRD